MRGQEIGQVDESLGSGIERDGVVIMIVAPDRDVRDIQCPPGHGAFRSQVLRDLVFSILNSIGGH